MTSTCGTSELRENRERSFMPESTERGADASTAAVLDTKDVMDTSRISFEPVLCSLKLLTVSRLP